MRIRTHSSTWEMTENTYVTQYARAQFIFARHAEYEAQDLVLSRLDGYYQPVPPYALRAFLDSAESDHFFGLYGFGL